MSEEKTTLAKLNEVLNAATEVADDYDETGCDGCGTVMRDPMKKLVEALKQFGYISSIDFDEDVDETEENDV